MFTEYDETINNLANNLLDILQVDYYKLDVYTRMKIEEFLANASKKMSYELEKIRESSYNEGYDNGYEDGEDGI